MLIDDICNRNKITTQMIWTKDLKYHSFKTNLNDNWPYYSGNFKQVAVSLYYFAKDTVTLYRITASNNVILMKKSELILTLVVGTRPNFIKIAPLIRAIQKHNARALKSPKIKWRLIHTGQHFDDNMSSVFFEQLQIPTPHINLHSGGGSQAEQTAKIMIAFEDELMEHPADMVLVVGDVTSTLACSIVAKKAGCSVAHVEAGIRSGDRTMPEEINRIVTDSITDLFFTTTPEASSQLKRSGIADVQIYFVGNVMIDSLLYHQKDFFAPAIWYDLRLGDASYWVVTLHRPSNVDEQQNLVEMIQQITNSCCPDPVIFPAHPRTVKQLKNLQMALSNLHIIDPLSYLEFNYLVSHARGIITDSGGISEECTVLNVPCLTLRNSTERLETVKVGTNELVGTNPENIAPYVKKVNNGRWKQGKCPDKWDGHTAERIVQILAEKASMYLKI